MHAAEIAVHEQLEHTGIVAGECEKIGLARWLPTARKSGTATTAMTFHELGFSRGKGEYVCGRPYGLQFCDSDVGESGGRCVDQLRLGYKDAGHCAAGGGI